MWSDIFHISPAGSKDMSVQSMGAWTWTNTMMSDHHAAVPNPWNIHQGVHSKLWPEAASCCISNVSTKGLLSSLKLMTLESGKLRGHFWKSTSYTVTETSIHSGKDHEIKPSSTHNWGQQNHAPWQARLPKIFDLRTLFLLPMRICIRAQPCSDHKTPMLIWTICSRQSFV
jgi:hypothetical protein